MLVTGDVEPTAAAIKRVVAEPAFQNVVVAVSYQGIAESCAAQILERDEDIAGGCACAEGLAGEVGGDARRRVRIIHGVIAVIARAERTRHAVEDVGMIAAEE